MKRLTIIIIATLLLTACNKKTIFNEERTFANDDWLRFNTEKFDVDINNIDNCYHLCMDMLIDTSLFREKLLPLAINIYGPNGDNRMFYGYLHVRENDRWQGEFVDGYLRVEQRLRQYFFFNTKGTHNIEIGQASNRYDLYGVKKIRFHIEKAEINYPK